MILQSGAKIDHFEQWNELYIAAGPGQAQIGGPQIIGTATIPLNYSILVRPPPPHTVLMDILIGFGHIVLILRFKA